EGGIAFLELRVGEGAWHREESEVPVEYVDATVVEVGGVEAKAGDGRRDGETLVDRADSGAVREHDRLVALGGMPAPDLACLGIEDEDRPRGRRPEDRTGGVYRHLHHERNDRSVGPVERGDIGAVVGDPPRRAGSGGETPGVDEMRIGGRRGTNLVRDERMHRVDV